MSAPLNPAFLLRLEVEQMHLVMTVLETERENLVRNLVPMTLDGGVSTLAQLDEAKRLTEQRHTVMRAAGFIPDLQGTLDWIKTDQDGDGALALWNNLLTIATQTQEINRVNGIIVQRRVESFNRQVDAVQRDRNGGATYGPDGKTRAHPWRLP
jgi:flagellar biosynthesis/type III secretory pathway chaperone